MTKAKRHNPLLILFDVWKLVRNSSFFVIYLYVIKAGSESNLITYSRIVFLFIFGITLMSIILKWVTHTYEVENKSFHLYKGLFNKSERTIPFSKIQNVNQQTSIFHRIFKVTSISFETGMTGEDARIKFEVVSQIEADQFEVYIESTNQDELPSIHSINDAIELSSKMNTENGNSDRTIHFSPTNGDILKVSFSSLSFLFLIPLLVSIYLKVNDIFDLNLEAEGIFTGIISSWWMMMIIVIILIITSAIFGIMRTFLKYGKFEILSDQERIYIKKGVMNEISFSIEKDKVQAIEVKQSIMKRLFGLAEVKLTSAGSLSSGEAMLEINSLYPYLPVRQAYEMISDILPSYRVIQKMNRLPKKSLWVRLLSPSWIWIIATSALFYFKPTFLIIEQGWIILSVILLLYIVLIRLLDFHNTRYILMDHFIQFKTGSLNTSLFVSKRDKVIEVKVTRNIIQKMLCLASIAIVNRAKPVHHSAMEDVTIELADSFYNWYMKRAKEIKVE